jgi:hypothetical protein
MAACPSAMKEKKPKWQQEKSIFITALPDQAVPFPATL